MRNGRFLRRDHLADAVGGTRWHALNMDVKGVGCRPGRPIPSLLTGRRFHAHRIHALGVPPGRSAQTLAEPVAHGDGVARIHAQTMLPANPLPEPAQTGTTASYSEILPGPAGWPSERGKICRPFPLTSCSSGNTLTLS